MDVDVLRDELKRDEGCVNSIYLDHLNLPTCGIGHLITEWDEEYGLEVGTSISEERVNELFDKDIAVTLEECKLLYNDFDVLPSEAQHIIANMMFNMGRPRLSRFHKMKKAIDARDWNEASLQMQDSKWYHQVTNRAERLVQRMKNITT
ncbi:Phage-related lysozyme (muraminidase) (COG3772) [uncultured Mediterranean phage uvMED]|mgnify:FL=1|nr:Phage-related lysozyme (muraminidase) (COG3772) [uncultured Mediterranean phage uvMED]